jgi:hypothetical protein
MLLHQPFQSLGFVGKGLFGSLYCWVIGAYRCTGQLLYALLQARYVLDCPGNFFLALRAVEFGEEEWKRED